MKICTNRAGPNLKHIALICDKTTELDIHMAIEELQQLRHVRYNKTVRFIDSGIHGKPSWPNRILSTQIVREKTRAFRASIRSAWHTTSKRTIGT